MLKINSKDLFYNKETNTFVVELSILNNCYPEIKNRFPQEFQIQSGKTGVVKDFVFSHYDKNESEDEIYGANYKSTCGTFNALIIND